MSDFERLVKEFQRTRKKSAEIDRGLGGILADLEHRNDRVLPLLKNLREASEYFSDIDRHASDILQAVNEMTREIEPLRSGYGARLGGQINDLLSARTKRKIGGNFPWWQDGSLWIEVPDSSAEAKIWFGKEQELIGSCPLEPVKIVDALENARSGLSVHKSEGEFVDRVCRSYETFAKSKQVPIVDLMHRVAWDMQSAKFKENPTGKLFRDYSRAQFSFEISRYRSAFLATGFHLVVASRENTRKRANFLWVPECETGKGHCFAFVERNDRPVRGNSE